MLLPVKDRFENRESEEQEQKSDDQTDIATDGVEDVIIRLSDQNQDQPEIGFVISL